MSDVLGYLHSKGLHTVPAGLNEVHLSCIFCNEDPNKRGRLYVNTDPNHEPLGALFCHLCGKKGGLRTLKSYFGDPITKESETPPEQTQILRTATSYYQDCLADHPKVLSYLRDERMFALDTILKHQFGWADGGLKDHLHEAGFDRNEIAKTGLVKSNQQDFLQNVITIPYVVGGMTVMIRGKEIGGKYLTPPGQKSRIYWSDNLWDVETVVLAEGEMDQVVLDQLGINAVGIPGANIWQDSWSDYFTNIKRVYVMFDPDSAGKAGAEKIRSKLGPKVRVIDLPVPPDEDPGEVDISWLHQNGQLSRQDVDNLLKQGSGSLLVSPSQAREAFREIQALRPIKFGIPGLDAAIAPGILPTQILVLLATSGTGKTISLLNMFQRMTMHTPDLNCLFLSLEQTRWEWWDRARRIHRFYNLDSNEDEALAYWENRIRLVDENKVTEEGLNDLIDEYEADRGKLDVLAIDYLGYWAQAFKGERYERTSNAILAVKALCKERKITGLVPAQSNKNNEPGEELKSQDSRDSGVAYETADFFLTMWNPDAKIGVDRSQYQHQIHSRLTKSRHGRTGTLFTYQFAPISLTLVPIDDPLSDRAAWEARWANEGLLTWEQAVEKHLEHYSEREAMQSDYLEEDF